jgi:hypothetical protein
MNERGLSQIFATILILILVSALGIIIGTSFLGYTDLLVNPDIRPFTRSIPGGALAYYGFDEGEGSMTEDLSGLGNNANLNLVSWMGSDLWRMHKYPSDHWVALSGTNSYLWAPSSPSLNPTGNLTVEAWVKWNVDPASVPTTNRQTVILQKGYADTYQYRLWHDYTTGQKPRFRFSIRIGGTTTTLTSTTRPQKDVWYHVVGTWNNRRTATRGTMTLYVTGVQEAQNTNVVTGNLYTGIYRLSVGGRYTNTGMTAVDRLINGEIDEVGIYNRWMTNTEVQSRYSSYLN